MDFSKRSLVWLDYDGHFERFMATDLSRVVRDSPSGTFLALTFRAGFPTEVESRSKELERLRQQFPEYVAEDAKPQLFDGPKFAEFARKTLGAILVKAIDDADAGEANPLK
ncbi:MAG: O-methyltransferase, partial [Pseudomonadota bacterium]